MPTGSRFRDWFVAMALCLSLPACAEDIYREPLEGPIRLGGRTSMTLPRAIRTPGLRRRLCLVLPQGYDVDVHSREVIAPSGERGTLSARLRTESGAWFSLEFVSRILGKVGEVCLESAELSGRLELSFVELELNSGLAWESPQGYWISAEKL